MSISVTSLAEVWIEIELQNTMLNAEKSLPLRKCGLKYGTYSPLLLTSQSHFPCGSVD